MADSEYPIVFRVSDPLLVRLSELSLLVGNTNFYAKIKYGKAFKGFVIYSSGLGIPIYTENKVDSGKSYTKNGVTYIAGDKVIQEEIKQEAIKWLDTLQERLNEQHTGNSIKEAIDRLCWQLHVDITGSNTDFTELQDFTNIQSDKFIDTSSESINYNINRIRMSIMDDNDPYTVSRALRELDDLSVSASMREQTETELREFSDIETRIGSPSEGNSIWNSVNTIDNHIGVPNSGDTISSLSNTIKATTNNTQETVSTINTITETIDSNIGTSSDIYGDSVFAKLYSVNTTVGTINSNIGDFSSKQYAGHSLSEVIGDNTINHQGYTVLGQLNDLMDR